MGGCQQPERHRRDQSMVELIPIRSLIACGFAGIPPVLALIPGTDFCRMSLARFIMILDLLFLLIRLLHWLRRES